VVLAVSSPSSTSKVPIQEIIAITIKQGHEMGSTAWIRRIHQKE
jgi:hypothetical protein